MEKRVDKAQWHTIEEIKIVEMLQTDPALGLTIQDVEVRTKKYGLNKIEESSRRSLVLLFLSQFNSSVVYLLLAASALSAYFGEWADAFAIIAVLLINSCIAFYMEMQAQRSMDALKKLTAVPSKVIRNGKLMQVDSVNIVPGDIVYLEAGDMITADSRIIKATQLQVNEASLTGESTPIDKLRKTLQEDVSLHDRVNMLYKGTYITKGNAHAVVVATGMKTELGEVARLVESADQSTTPLEKKLAIFSRKLIYVTLGLVVIIFIAGLLHGQKVLHMLQTCIALSVAAIPEGLPIVATLALANGMIKMARKKVIIRKLSAVETLGGTGVICTDKTGTLTENKITVSCVATPEKDWQEGNRLPELESFNLMIRIAVLCNTSEVAHSDDEGAGDPLETGLLKFALSQHVDIQNLRNSYPLQDQEPFTSETKMMATFHKIRNENIVFCKGAAEEVIANCTLIFSEQGIKEITEDEKKFWLEKAHTYSASGMKVIAGAYNPSPQNSTLIADLVFAGLFGMIDPPAEGVLHAIENCVSAGIRVIMITGDHPATAKNIALRLGIMKKNEKVMLGKHMNTFSALTDQEKNEWALTNVFARVSPQQKLDLVKVLQEKGHIVGMTGDGVNDAPALRKADIGIAMGRRGTQVAQQAADIVLQDDSFKSIVVAIREGRVIFENIHRFIVYLLSSNMSELFVISAVAIFNLPFPLLPLQILFINIITDIFPALALGVTEGSKGIMKLKPIASGGEILGKKGWKNIVLYSLILALIAVSTVLARQYFFSDMKEWDSQKANNILFFTLVSSQLFHVFNMYRPGGRFFGSEVMRNKFVWIALSISFTILVLAYFIIPLRKLLGLQHMELVDHGIVAAGTIASMLLMHFARKVKLITP